MKKTAEGVVDEALEAAKKEEEGTAKAEEHPAEPAPAEEQPAAASRPSVTIVKNPEVEANNPHALKPTDKKSGVSALALLETYVIPGVAAAPKENRPVFKPPCTATLIVGTQKGGLIAHTLAWGADSVPIEVNLVKEVIFQHGAPVISILALDSQKQYTPVSSEKNR